MKELEILLKKYADGTLSSDEKEELNLLTHRESIVTHASKHASAARRRRIGEMTLTASLVIATGLTFYRHFSSSDSASAPLIAQQTTTILPTTQETSEAISALPVEDMPTTVTKRTVSAPHTLVKDHHSPMPTNTQTAPVIVEEIVPSNTEAPNQVVACNTQCSPDSVINDIWRFLQV